MSFYDIYHIYNLRIYIHCAIEDKKVFFIVILLTKHIKYVI
jgi:hypothetical protein